MQLQVDVDESDVAGLTPGEPATFEVERRMRDETFHGTVTQVRLQPIAAPPAAIVRGRARFDAGFRAVSCQLRGHRPTWRTPTSG